MGLLRSSGRAGRRALLGVAVGYTALLLGVSLVHTVWPQRAGVLALSQVLAPYLFLPLLGFAPLALLKGTAALRIGLVCGLLVFGVRFWPVHQASTPSASPPSVLLTVMTWNVREGGQPDQVRPVLATRPADIVALEEGDWRWILPDPALRKVYPYRAALRDDPVGSIVLLSSYPIQAQGDLPLPPGMRDATRGMWVRVETGEGHDVTVVAGHPPPAQLCRGPCQRMNIYFSQERDARFVAMRAFLDPLLTQGERVLLVGDFNLTDREPAYQDLARGLFDAQQVAGQGWGNTWRPAPLMNWGLPLLRIDYLFSSPNLIPLTVSVDCTPRGSDHCILQGRFAAE